MNQPLILDSIGLIPIILLGASFVIPLLSFFIKSKKFYDIYAFIFTFLAFVFSLKTFIEILHNNEPALYPFGGWPPPVGILYEVDMFSAIMGLIVLSISLLVVIYSWWYLKENSNYSYVWYYTLLLGLVGGMIGCLYTGDAFNFFVMMEVVSISAYALVAFYRSRFIALEASMKYAFMGSVATTMYFIALLFIYGTFGTLNMADIAIRAHNIQPISLWGNMLIDEHSLNIKIRAISATIATILALWTFTFKAALFPNHFWLPDAHAEAPAPISALLSGLVVDIGVYATIRWLYTIFGPDSLLSSALVLGISMRDILLYSIMILGVISSIFAVLMMNVQNDAKRLLAYSTISHIGLVFITLSQGLSNVHEDIRVYALATAIYHLINHAVAKSLLFLSTGVLIHRSGTRDITKWNGIGRTCPLVAVALVIGIFTLMGVPPLGGFFSKLMMFQTFIGRGLMWLAIVLILETTISIPAYIKLINATIFGVPTTKLENRKEDSIYVVYIVLLLLILMCINLGVLYLIGYIPTSYVDCIRRSLGIEGIQRYINAVKNLITLYFSPCS